jgi:DNA-binding GntR family transcriptional regulator
LRAGQFVTQKELLDHLQMSLGPVRTALARLESEGFVQILAQRGIQIVEPSISLYRNITQVRIALEKEAWSKFAATPSDQAFELTGRFHLTPSPAGQNITPACCVSLVLRSENARRRYHMHWITPFI